jgi:hypothetical protein
MASPDASAIVIYTAEGGEPRIRVRLEGETAWLTQKLIAELFEVSVPTVNEHIKTIYADGELSAGATIRKFLIVQKEGNRDVEREIEHYSLGMILAVGYRVRSNRGVQFRTWATERLTEYMVKGFVMDDERLKNLGGGGYWKELLSRIRDIRSSEKVFYRQLLDIYATSVDYDAHAEVSKEFFKKVQNKVHFA